MALSGMTFDPVQAYGKEYKLLFLKLTVGASGAVGSVDGKGFPSTGTAGSLPSNGSVTKEATAGQYTIVLPGTGSVHDIFLLGAYVEDAADDLTIRVNSKDLSARSLTLQCLDNDGVTGVANPSDGTILHVSLLVKNSAID